MRQLYFFNMPPEAKDSFNGVVIQGKIIANICDTREYFDYVPAVVNLG